MSLCECGCGAATEVSPYTDRPRGYVRGRPRRFVNGHQNRGRGRKVMRYVEEDRGHATPCWVWKLGITPNGYGHLAAKAEGFVGAAHRYYYEQAHGPIPAGAHVDHLCRVRECVNPEHMEVVTCAENARRGDNAKLTYEDVAEIRRLRRQGLTQQAVAERFGVARQTVGDIENGRTWAAPGGVVTSGA